MDVLKAIRFSEHALEKMVDRGATEGEVILSIREGGMEPTRKNRYLFRKNFPFNNYWRGKHYAIKQIAPIVAEESDHLVVVTVFVYYF